MSFTKNQVERFLESEKLTDTEKGKEVLNRLSKTPSIGDKGRLFRSNAADAIFGEMKDLYEKFFANLKKFATEEDSQIMREDDGPDLPVEVEDSLGKSAYGEIDKLCLEVSNCGFSVPAKDLEKRHSQLYPDLQEPPIMFNFNQFANTATFEITNFSGIKPKLTVKLDKDQNLTVRFAAYKKDDKMRIIPMIDNSNESCDIQHKPSGMSSEHQMMTNKMVAEMTNSRITEKIVLKTYLDVEEKSLPYDDVKKVFNSEKLTPEAVDMAAAFYLVNFQKVEDKRKFLLAYWLKEQMRAD